jgi:hypothetical protein
MKYPDIYFVNSNKPSSKLDRSYICANQSLDVLYLSISFDQVYQKL